SREATIMLYAPALDPHLQKITELADRVVCIYSEQAPAKSRKAEAKMPGAQRTLKAYSWGGPGGCGERSSPGGRWSSLLTFSSPKFFLYFRRQLLDKLCIVRTSRQQTHRIVE
ncbi:MAG: hypothetical protein E4G89_04955, partial [Methanothrix sp.]